MKNKKRLGLVGGISVILVLAMLLFPGCAPAEEEAPVTPTPVTPTPVTPTPVAPPPEEEIEILIGGAGVGGNFYPLACGLMTIFNNNVPGVRATALATGGTSINIAMVDGGEILIGFGTTSKVSDAYHGREKYDHPHQLNLFSCSYSGWSVYLTLDPKIKTVYDLKGKRVAIGEPGASTPRRCEAILEGLGMKKDVDYSAIMLGETEATEALKDGHVDAVFNQCTKGKPCIVEVTTVKNVHFISIPFTEETEKVMTASLMEAGFVMSVGTLPKGTFRGMDEGYKTFTAPTSIFIDSRADEDFVYTLVKAMWENIDLLGEVHPIGKEVDINEIAVNYGFPLHPGALKYYIEQGVIAEDPFKG